MTRRAAWTSASSSYQSSATSASEHRMQGREAVFHCQRTRVAQHLIPKRSFEFFECDAGFRHARHHDGGAQRRTRARRVPWTTWPACDRQAARAHRPAQYTEFCKLDLNSPATISRSTNECARRILTSSAAARQPNTKHRVRIKAITAAEWQQRGGSRRGSWPTAHY